MYLDDITENNGQIRAYLISVIV